MAYQINPFTGKLDITPFSLDGAGKIPSDYLPSYVDDVVEYDDLASFPGTGETGKIYVAKDTGYTYRWTGSVYVRIGSGGEVELNLGSDSSPSLYFTGDPNTGIYSPGANQVAISTNGTGRLFVDSSGNVGIGTSSPGVALDVNGDARADGLYGYGDTNTGIEFPGSDVIAFKEGGAEAARIDSSGRLLVGTSSSTTSRRLQVEGTDVDGSSLSIRRNINGSVSPFLHIAKSRSGSTGGYGLVNSGDSLGVIQWHGADGSTDIGAARIGAEVDGTPGANDMPGRLVFSTTADGGSSPTERMRITQDGSVLIGNTGTLFGNTGTQISASGTANFSRDSSYPLLINRQTTDGTIVQIRRNWSTVGTISVTTTATAYNTSSDYRLKENVTPVIDGITRLQQLKPSRFNFIADPDKTVDGFIAHEVQPIVPEAVTGEKDAVDDEGNPVYQGIDQSKLVPLLTAALQEAVAKIESLEARLTAAGI